MSINLEQICFQRRHTDGQQAHERMLNIATYQRCVSQNYNEVTPHMGQNSHQKIIQAIIAGEGVEKRKPYGTVDGNVKWYSHYKKSKDIFQESKNRTII